MRLLALILILFGGVGLANEGFNSAIYAKDFGLWVPPLASGIALVFGLILLASTDRGEQD